MRFVRRRPGPAWQAGSVAVVQVPSLRHVVRQTIQVKGISKMNETQVITVDEAMDQLRTIATTSPLGGDTCLCV